MQRIVGIRWNNVARLVLTITIISGIIFVLFGLNKKPESISTAQTMNTNSTQYPWQEDLSSWKKINGGSWGLIGSTAEITTIAGPHDPINMTLFKGIQPGWTLEQVNQYLHQNGHYDGGCNSYTWYDYPDTPENSPFITVGFAEGHATVKLAENLGN